MPPVPTTRDDAIVLLEQSGEAGDMSRRLLAAWPAAVAAWQGTKRSILDTWAETAGVDRAAILVRGMPLVRTGAALGDGTIDQACSGYLIRHALAAAPAGPDAGLQSRMGQQRAEIAALRSRVAAYEKLLLGRQNGAVN